MSSLIIISMFVGLLANLNVNNNIPDNLIDGKSLIGDQDLGSSGTYEVYHTDEWLDNGDFDSGITPWTNTSSGDTTDVNATFSSQAANYEVLGEQKTFSFVEDPPLAGSWTVAQDPNFPFYPDTYTIDGSGCDVSHYWEEGADQSVAVTWKRNFTMQDNMSDYVITSASINSEVNGEVTTDSYQSATFLSDGIEAGSDLGDETTQYATGDYTRFYILISDLYDNNVYEIAYNQTTNLGQDDEPYEVASSPDTLMIPVTEETLIIYLTSVLNNDDYNFTMTLGIRIWCEDNYAQDSDEWLSMVISSVNLTFTYEKKIDQFSSVSWTQVGDTISGSNIDITQANLTFQYMVDQTWPTDSPNSELRIIINGTTHSEAVALLTAPTSYGDAKTGGFDITYLIKKDVNISLTIQLFIADEFELNSTLTISIENVSLEISYTETLAETPTEIQLFMNSENKTLPRLIQIPIGETVNITINYNESGGFVNGASVVLTGYGTAKNLTEDAGLEHYNYTIDTSNLTLGEHYFTVTASKTTYETQEITFSISVVKRNSFIDNININFIEVTSASIPWNEIFAISINYNDTLTNNSIAGATVQLTGTSLLKSFSENGDFYNISLNSNELQIGANYLTISASATNNTLTSEIITITVNERTTELDTYLNEQVTTTINIPYAEILNITAVYKDSATTNFINGITVELRVGETVVYNFTKHPSYNQYNLTLDTADIGVGVNYYSIYAKQDNYTVAQVSITITVTDRDTDMDIYLDQELKNNIEVPWNDLINITAIYNDNNLTTFIDGADLDLKEGPTTIYNFTKNPTYDQYNLTINTADLGLGVHVFSVYAIKGNYTSSSESITITVTERETELDIYLNGSTELSQIIPWNDLINITAMYNDMNLTTFIDGASISLKDGAVVIYNFTKHPTYDQYNLTINVADLGLGVHALTVYAEKGNYTISLEIITITVSERETGLEIYLNGSINLSKDVAWNDLLNITAIYKDSVTKLLIENAIVSLKDGSIILENFSRHITYDQYYLTINATDLGLGVHALSVHASRDNYTFLLGSITITVSERATELDLYLNSSLNTNIDVPWNDLLNITAMYNDDITKLLIENATISLKNGAIILYNFTRHLTYDQYYLTINATDLGLGTKALSINANKDNYTLSIGSITITVSERDTELTILLNETVDTYIEVPWNDFLNITAIYNDNITSLLIEGATVSLKEGSNVLYNFTRHITYNQYYLTICTSDFGVGIKSLTVYADKGNYSTALSSITVAILNRETYLNITLNGQDKTSEKAIALTSGEILNITAYYYDDATNAFIDNALVNVTGTAFSDSLDESVIYSHYNISINTTIFGVGVVFLTVFAQQDNYSYVATVLTITITETGTNYKLYLNGIDKTTEKTMSLTVNQTLIIAFNYTTLVSSFLNGAQVNLTGGIFDEELTEEISNGTYWISLNTSDFNQGINFFNLFATKVGYEPQALLITIEIIERQTNMTILLNGTDITTTPSVKIPIGEHINFTVVYWDIVADTHVETATVRLIGEGHNLTIIENPPLKQYTLILDSDDLNQGINFLSITAQRNNYEPQSIIVSIEVIEKITDYDVFLNDDNKTSDPTLTIPMGDSLNITMKFFENGTGAFIENANISIFGGGLDDNLTQSIEQYSLLINTDQLSIGVNFINLYATKDNYQSQSVLLVITVHLKYTDYNVFLNDDNKTSDPSLTMSMGDSLNVTLKFFENGTSTFIQDATVSIVGGINDNLNQSIPLEQYTIIINSSQLNPGVNFLSLYATKDNYEAISVLLIITLIEKDTEFDVFMNGINKTLDKTITLPIGDILNITFKFFENGTWTFVENATISITGEGFNDNLAQSIPLEQYSIIINTATLDIGVRFLTVYATKTNYKSQSVVLRITVRRIAGEVKTISGEPNVGALPGEAANLEIELLDENGARVLGATVTYTWEHGQGSLTDTDNDGVYEATLEVAPSGSYTLTITVYAGDNYDFTRFDMTVTVQPPGETAPLMLILTALAIGLAALAAGFIAYQRKYKVPRPIRRTRKYRKNLKKDGPLNVTPVVTSDEAFDGSFKKETAGISYSAKAKIQIEGPIEKTALLSEGVFAGDAIKKKKEKKPNEKKEEEAEKKEEGDKK